MDQLVLARLLQLADTSFPTGAFAHSLGLEGLHATGELQNERDLQRALGRQLQAMSTSDLVALRAAHAVAVALRPDDESGSETASEAALQESVLRLCGIDELLLATRFTAETREALVATGSRLRLAACSLLFDGQAASWSADPASESPAPAEPATFGSARRAASLLKSFDVVCQRRESPGCLPVVWGLAAAAMAADCDSAVTSFAFASCAALAAAGQRLVPLGPLAAQSALWACGDAIASACAESLRVDPSEMFSFAPEFDVYSARHERQRVRLFIS